MKRIAIVATPFLLLTFCALLVTKQTAAPVLSQPESSITAVPYAPFASGEARALWIVRYTLTSPEAIRSSVKRAKDNGFTDLVVQVRGRGEAFYDSRLEPRASDLAGQPADFDPFAFMLKEAHAAGLRVHAWLNIYVVANADILPVPTDHVIYKHPDWLMTPRPLAATLYGMDPRSSAYLNSIRDYTNQNKAQLEGIYVSPAHPEVQESLYQLLLEVVDKYDVDGLHYDYIRYPNANYDFSRVSLDRFRAEIEPKLSPTRRAALAAQSANNPLAYVNALPDAYAAFQRAQVSSLVERVYKAVKARKPQVTVSSAVAANVKDGFQARFQDWRAWMQRGLLDVVCPMAYTPDTDVFRQQVATAVQSASGRQVWGGIGSWRQPVDSTLEKIFVTRKLGASGFILFSYDSAVQFSDLNPQKDYLERLRDGLAIHAN